MAIQTEPTRIQIPFADSGTKNVIPNTNSKPSASQAASWTDGFPTQCSLPLSAGGIPPARADFNGLFNVITQSERFTEEGGVWAWDATVDYGANRLVLGSDGLLYWSVAQSGPYVGGAQDPTADTAHTYWSTMPMLTPPLGDDSSKAATTEWTRDLAVAPVYVSPSGSDSNDGLSATAAVQTLQKAYDIAVALPQGAGAAVIKVAAGSYAGGVSVSQSSVILDVQGNVSASGDIIVKNGASLSISGSSHTLTLVGNISVQVGAFAYIYLASLVQTGRISLEYMSVAFINCQASMTGTGTIINVVGNSSLRFSSSVSCDCSGADNAIQIHGLSSFRSGSLTLDVTNISGSAIHVDSMSSAMVDSIAISGTSSSGGVFCGSGSTLYIVGDLTISKILTNGQCIFASTQSSIIVFGKTSIESAQSGSVSSIKSELCSLCYFFGNVTVKQNTNGSAIHIRSHGTIKFFNSISISATVGIVRFFLVDGESECRVEGNMSLNGTVSDVSVGTTQNSLFWLASSSTVSGTVTGSRYYVETGGQIIVNGAGASRIPGSAAGIAASGSYGYYG